MSSDTKPRTFIPALLVMLGMIPFIASAYMVFRFEELVSAHMSADGAAFEVFAQRLQISLMSLLIYGAVILSFLGGVRWGVALANNPSAPSRFVLLLSILGALSGWGLTVYGAFFKTNASLLWAYAIIFAMHLLWDTTSPELPRWFKTLRFIASGVAIASFLAVSYLFVGV